MRVDVELRRPKKIMTGERQFARLDRLMAKLEGTVLDRMTCLYLARVEP